MSTSNEPNTSSTTFFSPLDFGPRTPDELEHTVSTSKPAPAPSSSPAPAPQAPPAPTSSASPPHSPPSTDTLSAYYTQTEHGIHYTDEGEKDDDGNVKVLIDPCEECGGKVVWATKGSFYIVCQACGEVQ